MENFYISWHMVSKLAFWHHMSWYNLAKLGNCGFFVKNKFCELYIMTNGVKTRVLTSFVMIYQLQFLFFCNFYIPWHMVSKLEVWHHMSWSVTRNKIHLFTKKKKKHFFAFYIPWQMVSKREVWHHMSWYVPMAAQNRLKRFCNL